MLGFDFYRDPLGAMKPGMTFEDFYKAGVANKPKVMATQRKLLESRYNLEAKLDPAVKMSRGKPIAVVYSEIAGGDELGSAGRVEPGRDSRAGHLPVQSAASRRPRRWARWPSLSPDAD